MTTDTEARELVERLQVHAYRMLIETATAHNKGGFMTTGEDRAECEMIPDKAADTITALLAENERLRRRLHRIAQPGRTIAYCQNGHEEAVLIARAALKGGDQ